MDWVATTAVWGAMTGTAALALELWKWSDERRRRSRQEKALRPRLAAEITAGAPYGYPSLYVVVENQGPRAIDYPEVRLVIEPVSGGVIGGTTQGADAAGVFRFLDRPETIEPGESRSVEIEAAAGARLPRGPNVPNRMRVEVSVDGEVVSRFEDSSVQRAVERYGDMLDLRQRGSQGLGSEM